MHWNLLFQVSIERKNRIARLYFIQGICVEKRERIWIADVLLKEVRLRDNTKSVGIKLCARTIESMKKLIIDLAQLYGVHETLCVRIPESEEEGLLWSYQVEW